MGHDNRTRIGMSVKKTLLVATILLSASNLFAIDREIAMKFYFDGIYDSYSQIEDSIKKGLKKDRLYQFRNKYIVYKEAGDLPFVKLLMLKTIAYKNNLTDVAIGKSPTTNKNYVVFGGYDRKADALYIKQRLAENGISAKVEYNKETLIRNPIIIKKYVSDARRLIKNLPVKVIEIEKRYYIPQKEKVKPPVKIKIDKNADKDILRELKMLKKYFYKTKISTGRSLLYVYRKDLAGYNAYTKGDYVTRHLILKDYSYVPGKYIKAILATEDGREFVLVKKIKKPSKTTAKKSSHKSKPECKPKKSKKGKNKHPKKEKRKSEAQNSSSSVQNPEKKHKAPKEIKPPKIENRILQQKSINEISKNTVRSSKNKESGFGEDGFMAQKNAEVKNIKEKEKKNSFQAPKEGTYVCDFSKIRTFAYSLKPSYSTNRKPISELPKGGDNRTFYLGMEVAKEGQATIRYTKLKMPGTKTFYVRYKSFMKHCRVKK